jgi:(R,R)-butanediol dehydrogenase/meso-butanediol dehydrogenase/diacetyl reductase
MKAAVFRAIGEPLSLETVPDPSPRKHEIVFKVERCGICGSDLHITEHPMALGQVLGHEYAGEVVEVGSAVKGVKIGDRVAAMPVTGCGECSYCLAGEPSWCANRQLRGGGYGQFAVASGHECVALPPDLSMDDGALVEPLSVGLHGVELAELKPNAKVLIIGAGPIGLATAFWSERLGAGKIAVTARSDRRAGLAMEMGATAFVPGTDRLDDAVQEALGGRPDVVFECVGARGMIDQSTRLVRGHGTVVVLGICWTDDTFTPFRALNEEIRIQFSAFYHRRDFQTSIDMLSAGHVAPRAMITDTVGLDDLPPTFEALRNRTHQCKVMVDLWGQG